MRVHLLLLLLLVPSSPIVAQTRPKSTASRPAEVVVRAPTWTPDAIKADPARFIAHATQRLRASITAAESAQTSLREASEKLDRLKQENAKKLASKGAALDTLKDSFQAPGREWPLLVAGRVYGEAAFMKEVDRLLADRRLLVAMENQIVLAAEQAGRTAMLLAMQITHDQVTLDTLEASKSLIEKPLSPGLERILVSVHERMSTAEDPSATAAIRSVAELMQAASRKSRLTDPRSLSRPTATEFLSGKPESRK
jgi:hypothetical protein